MTSPITVLIVEDEPLLRMNISDRLDDLGFHVLEAANADEAIAMLAGRSDVEVMFTYRHARQHGWAETGRRRSKSLAADQDHRDLRP